MTPTVFALVLFAAVLHATWNAIVKGAGDKLLATALVTSAASVIALAGLPFLPPPAPASWSFLAASAVLQFGYYVLLVRTYQAADMSLAYPLMRGAAPLLVAVAGAILGERLTPAAWAGIGVLCAGILVMAAASRGREHRRGVALALANAVVIASYTLVDGLGARRSGAPIAYALWLFLMAGPPILVWAWLARRNQLGAYLRANWALGLAGGGATVVCYGLALWAMTVAPIAVIAALRETSILFGAAISTLVLRERMTPGRALAAGTIVVGAMVLRLA